MKLSITDEFLWDLYTLISGAGDVLTFILRPYPTMYNSLPGPSDPTFKKYRKERGIKRFSKLIYYLKTKGYIKVKSLEGKQAILLTKNGVDKALKASFKLDKRKRKDGKWLMLVFDIPKNHKKSRALLRSILHNLGYKMFQQSVWINPYDVLEKTQTLMQIYSLEKYVKIFLIEEI